MDIQNLLYAIPVAGVVALIYAYAKAAWVSKQDAGTEEMQGIAKLIQDGAIAFLKAEYKVLAIFVVIVAALLAFANAGRPGQSPIIAVSFVIGAIASALAGYFGMKVATNANVRTTAAARNSLPEALNVAFSGGAVMGMSVVGLALLGLGSLFLFFKSHFGGDLDLTLSVIAGFSMGASSIALFARVGGGIYTKAADVGADLVGKVEAGLPEDDPRNPATIADNVGDNVGDVAGMGADLFESYVGAIIGTMVLALGITAVGDGVELAEAKLNAVILPLFIAAAGIICSILGTFVVRTKEGGNPQHALDTGAFGAAGVMAIATFGIANWLWPEQGVTFGTGETAINVDATAVGIATIIGLAVGVAVGIITSYYCSMGKKPVNSIVEQSKTGEATNIIAGIGLGMESTMWPILLIAAGTIGAAQIAGLYGVAIAALGMLSTTGIQLAVDAYGPIADNAGGIAEMSHQEPEVRERTDLLDAVGNTTAAIGKGFAIASAAMTALALFAAFMQQAGITSIDVSNPKVMGGLFVGAMLPFLFSSMAMKAVGLAAMDMITEVRRQFREISGLKEGNAKPDVERCIKISTDASIRQMILPGLLAVITPVVVGFTPFLGPETLGGLLAGVTASGVLLAIFMSNAGGAWDNAKKSFEGEGAVMSDGEVFKKGTPAHNASVVGDTVGDPFKDTAGPSLNILVKLMSVVALVIAPLIAVNANSASNDQDKVAVVAKSNQGEAATKIAEPAKKTADTAAQPAADKAPDADKAATKPAAEAADKAAAPAATN